jgi:hypothetical protein
MAGCVKVSIADPDPLVRGTDPDTSIIKHLSLKNDINVATTSNKQKNLRIRTTMSRIRNTGQSTYRNNTSFIWNICLTYIKLVVGSVDLLFAFYS